MRALIAVSFLLTFAVAVPAAAQTTGSQDEKIMRDGSAGGTDTAPPMVDDEEISPTYSSIGVQKVAADFDNVKDSINLDFTLIGFRIPTVPWAAVELNLGGTIAPGQVDQTSSSGGTTCPIIDPFCTPSEGTTATSQGDFQSSFVGLFGVFRSTGKFFVMGKYGYRYLNTSIDQLVDDRSGSAYGAGVGYRWNRKGSYVELGYTKLGKKVSGIGLSISYSYDRNR